MKKQLINSYNKFRPFRINLYFFSIAGLLFAILALTLLDSFIHTKEDIIKEKNHLFSIHSQLSQKFIDYTLRDYQDKLAIASDVSYQEFFLQNNKFIELVYSTILKISPDIYQIRLIDRDGLERYRLNKINNKIFETPNDRLQNKSDRFYFIEAMRLDRGEVYISKITLNQELGQIETPYLPTIRFAVPMTSPNANKEGIVIINCNAEFLINFLSNIQIQGCDDYCLLDENGFYIYSSNPKNKLWGDSENLNNGFSLKNENPALFKKIKENKNGFFYCGSKYIYSYYRTVQMGVNGEKYYITGYIPESIIFTSALKNCFPMIIGGFTAYIFVLIVLFYIFRSLKTKENTLVKLNEKLTEKDIALTNINKNLKSMYAQANKIKKELKLANRAKSEFLSTMSHELRTPLNAIIGFSEVIIDESFGALNESQKDYMSEILGAGKHLLALINDILDISKIESGKMELQLSEVNLRSIISNSLLMIKEKCHKHNINITEKIEVKDDFIFIADERKIKQCLFNLLSNAAKFTPDNGEITIGAGINKENIEIYVKDTGIGIEKKDKDKVFAPFEQIDSALSRKHAGTGLGLSFSKALIELHGGYIHFKSKGKDKGAIFYINIPLNIKDTDVKKDEEKIVIENKNAFEWNESFSVKVKIFDKQHRKLFNIINNYHEVLLSDRPEKDLDILFYELQKYGQEHLKEEEKLFEEYSYPDKELHISAHNEYIKKINDFKERRRKEKIDVEVLSFLFEWWYEHISQLDSG